MCRIRFKDHIMSEALRALRAQLNNVLLANSFTTELALHQLPWYFNFFLLLAFPLDTLKIILASSPLLPWLRKGWQVGSVMSNQDIFFSVFPLVSSKSNVLQLVGIFVSCIQSFFFEISKKRNSNS